MPTGSDTLADQTGRSIEANILQQPSGVQPDPLAPGFGGGSPTTFSLSVQQSVLAAPMKRIVTGATNGGNDGVLLQHLQWRMERAPSQQYGSPA